MFRSTTKLRNWFSFGIDRNPLLFSAAAVFLSTLFYVCVWSYVNVSKPSLLSIFTLECVLVVNFIFFMFMLYKHGLINWSVSESGIARDNWTIDQNGNGIAEGISEAGEPSIYFILNGYLEFYKKEDIEISAPIEKFLSHTYRNILVTNPNGTIKSTKIRCDNDFLKSASKKIVDLDILEKDTTELFKRNSNPSQDDKPSKSDRDNIPNTDATAREPSAGSSNAASQLRIQQYPSRTEALKKTVAENLDPRDTSNTDTPTTRLNLRDAIELEQASKKQQYQIMESLIKKTNGQLKDIEISNKVFNSRISKDIQKIFTILQNFKSQLINIPDTYEIQNSFSKVMQSIDGVSDKTKEHFHRKNIPYPTNSKTLQLYESSKFWENEPDYDRFCEILEDHKIPSVDAKRRKVRPQKAGKSKPNTRDQFTDHTRYLMYIAVGKTFEQYTHDGEKFPEKKVFRKIMFAIYLRGATGGTYDNYWNNIVSGKWKSLVKKHENINKNKKIDKK